MNPARLLHPSSFILPKSWSGSVSRILFPSRGEDHSSATRVAAVVEQPTRKLSMETGGSAASLFGLAPQGVCRAVAARAGRGALLPHRFTLASVVPLCGAADRRSVFCCTFRRVAAPGRYPACCPSEFGLSSAPRGTAILRSAPHGKSNSSSATKIANGKLLQFQHLRTIVGRPT